MDERYEEVRRIIAESGDITDFAEYGHGASEEWIEAAEAALGMTLPKSYKWWLRHYSGGEVGGEEFFSIYEIDFDTVVGGDIVYIHRIKQKNGLLESRQLAICDSDLDGTFYFDMSRTDEDGEAPVYSLVTGKEYARDFLEFLKKRIALFER